MAERAGSDTKVSLEPLRKTLESLREIRRYLLPFLQLLKDDHDDCRKHQSHRPTSASPNKKRGRHNDGDTDHRQESANARRRAEAEAAVALAIGTLRYMAQRLRGLDRGRKKGDPFRAELDKIRGMLVALRKLESKGADDKNNASSPKEKEGGKDQKTTEPVDENATKRQRR